MSLTILFSRWLRYRDTHTVDLGERYILVGQGLSDPVALPEQPIRIVHSGNHESLYRRGLVLGYTAIPLRRPLDEDTIRPEHRAVDIDCNAPARWAAWMRSTHGLGNWVTLHSPKLGT